MDKNIKILNNLTKTSEDFIFLHSSATAPYSTGNSILAYDKERQIISDDFKELESVLTSNCKKFDNAWFGYLSYGLKNKLENLINDKDFFISYPSLQFAKFNNISEFQSYNILDKFKEFKELNDLTDSAEFIPKVKYLKSNMSKEEYLDKVKEIKEHINKGDLYQANLTRKFYGEFEDDRKVKPFDIFLKLSQNFPAPYSAFMKFDDLYIISSSPELFIRVDSRGKAVTCPIKGSIANSTEEKQKNCKEELSRSIKDKAENLMITDLMRNDFSHSCNAGSVKVNGLFETSSFKTITHMHSTIIGELKEGETSLSLTKNCFPPGSMTGAPKIMAMEICSELEKHKRGIYSGALGYFAGDGSTELSVVIRTIIIKGNKFEFQVGGAIVYDSEPEKEWQETIDKSLAIAKTLQVDKKIIKL